MNKPSCMTTEQHTALRAIMAELTKAFPGLTPKELVEGPLAEIAFGRIPSYSNLTKHKVQDVSTVMVGSFVLCYALDPVIHEPFVVLIKRSDKGPAGEDRFGVPGGFTNLDFTLASTHTPASNFGEQPAEGAVRELCEEIVDSDGVPILDIAPSRLHILKSGINYEPAKKGRTVTQHTGFAVELTASEVADLQDHVERLHTDSAYQAKAFELSRDETSDVLFMLLRDAANLDASCFTHQHEHKSLSLLEKVLKASAVSLPHPAARVALRS